MTVYRWFAVRDRCELAGIWGAERGSIILDEKSYNKIKSDLLFVSLDSIIYHIIGSFPRVSEYVSMFSFVWTLPVFLKELYG